jgi:hypothetical protein
MAVVRVGDQQLQDVALLGPGRGGGRGTQVTRQLGVPVHLRVAREVRPVRIEVPKHVPRHDDVGEVGVRIRIARRQRAGGPRQQSAQGRRIGTAAGLLVRQRERNARPQAARKLHVHVVA